MKRMQTKKRLMSEPLEARLMLTVPDFALVDMNDESPTFDQAISPRHYEGQLTGWYFAHST